MQILCVFFLYVQSLCHYVTITIFHCREQAANKVEGLEDDNREQRTCCAVCTVAAPELPAVSTAFDYDIVSEVGVIGGSLFFARRWGYIQELWRQQRSAINVLYRAAHVRGAKEMQPNTKLFTTMNGRTAYIGCGSLPMMCPIIIQGMFQTPRTIDLTSYPVLNSAAPLKA